MSGIAVTIGSAGTPGDFTVTPPVATALAPGGTTTFSVTFTPTAPGASSAILQAASNDGDENPFEIHLTGTGLTVSEAWRAGYFGSPGNSGAREDLNDQDRDGIVNLVEFATGTDPLTNSPATGALVKNDHLLGFTCNRLKAAMQDVTMDPEWSESLTGSWSREGVTSPVVMSDDGTRQSALFALPAGGDGKRFVRLRVTRR